MTTVGIIGSGNIGTTVARLAIHAGHHVVLSNSRGPETLADTIAELGPRSAAATSSAGSAMMVDPATTAMPARPARVTPSIVSGPIDGIS